MKLLSETGNDLAQRKKVKAGEVRMQLLPAAVNDSGNLKSEQYNIRIALICNPSINQAAGMQYLNFGIKKSFCAVQGRDTLACNAFERIPGIRKNDFLYMLCFNKKLLKENNNDNLHLYITDTIAGFGKTEFEIKSQSLKKLEALK